MTCHVFCVELVLFLDFQLMRIVFWVTVRAKRSSLFFVLVKPLSPNKPRECDKGDMSAKESRK